MEQYLYFVCFYRNCDYWYMKFEMKIYNNIDAPPTQIMINLQNVLNIIGVKVGDIGPKLAFNTIDNGYLILNNVRIPRENMLMKNAQVNELKTHIVKLENTWDLLHLYDR